MASLGYSSPFSDRYGTETMRKAWSRTQRFRLLSAIWTRHHNAMVERAGVPLAVLSDPFRTFTDEQMEALVEAADEKEKEVGHDIVAMLSVYKDQIRLGSSSLAHTGLTSSDVLDQAVLHQTMYSLYQLYRSVRTLTLGLCSNDYDGELNKWLMGRTHLQPAEPTTLQHRYLLYAQDLAAWLEQAQALMLELRAYRGLMSGSVGNYANEVYAMGAFPNQPTPFSVGTRAKAQTLPRTLDLQVANLLDFLAAILHKVAFDYRLESGFGSVYDEGAEHRVGSSAMPYKRNPINAEAINSLARHIHHLCGNAWDTAAWQGLERTLDDSASRRAWLPEAFIASSDIVERSVLLFLDYDNIDETHPQNWIHLWGQARNKAYAEAAALLTTYGQVVSPHREDGQPEEFGKRLDGRLFSMLRTTVRHQPEWFEHFNVASPRELLDNV